MKEGKKYTNSCFQNMNIIDKVYLNCDFRGANFKNSTLVGVEFIKCTFGIYGFKKTLLILLALFSALSAGMFPTFEIFIIENIINSFDSNYINQLSRKDLFISLSVLNSIIICILIYAIFLRKILNYIYGFVGIIIIFFFLSIIFYGIELFPYILGMTSKTGLSTIIGSIVILFSFTLSLILIMSIVVAISGAVAMSIGTPSEYLLKDNNFSILGFSVAALSGLGSLLGAIIGSTVIIMDNKFDSNIYDVSIIFVSSLTSAFLFTIMMVIFGRQIFKLEHSELSSLRQIIISISSYFGTNFASSKLINCDFNQSDLKNTVFYNSKLDRTSFKYTSNLQLSNLKGTILNTKIVRDLLVKGAGRHLNLSNQDLTGANLDDSKLTDMDFEGAVLNGASFINANLGNSNLKQVHAIKTNFSYANMTGVCIDNWNIDSSTILLDTKADHIYIRKGERRPLSGKYEDGDFEKLFKEIDNTIDFLFKNGIDWVAFLETYKKLKVFSYEERYNGTAKLTNGLQYIDEESELAVKKIESVGDNVFVVRVAVPNSYNKELFYRDFCNEYEIKENLLTEGYRQNLKIKDEQLLSFKKQNTNLESMIGILKTNPLTINGVVNMIDKSSNIENIQISGSQNLIVSGDNNILNSETNNSIPVEVRDSIIHEIDVLIEKLNNSKELERGAKDDAIGKLGELSEDISSNNLTDINVKIYKSFFENTLGFLTNTSSIAKNVIETISNVMKLVS